MDPVPITDAKEIAVRRRAKAVLVLAFGGGRFAVTTFGMTRRQCDGAKRVNEQIARLIEDGTLEIPEELM